MNHTALALSSLLCLAAPAAFAHGPGEGYRHGRHGDFGGRFGREGRGERHGEYRMQVEQREGHWEQRVVQQWVPGRYETQVLPPSCAWYGGFQQCSPGVTQQVWREGGYVSATTWVWVADRW